MGSLWQIENLSGVLSYRLVEPECVSPTRHGGWPCVDKGIPRPLAVELVLDLWDRGSGMEGLCWNWSGQGLQMYGTEERRARGLTRSAGILEMLANLPSLCVCLCYHLSVAISLLGCRSGPTPALTITRKPLWGGQCLTELRK